MGSAWRVALAMGFAVVLLMPVAAAASLSGQLDVDRQARWQGAARVMAEEGVLDLVPAARAREPIELRWERAAGYRVTYSYEYKGPGPATFETSVTSRPPRNESLALDAATLTQLRCAEGCRALLLSEGAGLVGYDGALAGGLVATTTARAWGAAATRAGLPDSFYHEQPAGAWSFASSGATSTPLGDALPRAEGSLVLFLANATAMVRVGDETREITTLQTDRPEQTFGVPTGRMNEVPFLVLHLEGARLVAAPGSAAELIAPRPTIEVDGWLRAARAEGHLVVDGRRHDVERVPVLLEGRIVGQPGDGVDALVPVGFGTAYSTALRGDVSRVEVDGATVTSAAPLQNDVATGVTLAVLLLAIVGWKAWPPLAALYMRITSASVLRNPNRARVHEAIRARQGAGVADIVRATGLVEVVVRHHLRMLEAHALVLSRGKARGRRYFLAEVAPAPDEHAARLTLSDPTRMRVAESLVCTPHALTQKELAESLGLSRRLVSYHLSRLEASGMIEMQEGLPRRYRATARLESLVEPPLEAAAS